GTESPGMELHHIFAKPLLHAHRIRWRRLAEASVGAVRWLVGSVGVEEVEIEQRLLLLDRVEPREALLHQPPVLPAQSKRGLAFRLLKSAGELRVVEHGRVGEQG